MLPSPVATILATRRELNFKPVMEMKDHGLVFDRQSLVTVAVALL
jgi:hypothetical protein